MKAWRETTSTSPSGMHLGHHRALIKEFEDEKLETMRQELLQSQVDLMNLAMKHQYSYQRWQTVVNVMLLKEPGNTKVHRLRVIHIYEADLNLMLAVKWRQLIHHAMDNSLISPWQFGGLPGRDSLTPAIIEESQWEITRSSRRSFLRTDFDATSCYDRIVP
jgi:hypothetical protein